MYPRAGNSLVDMCFVKAGTSSVLASAYSLNGELPMTANTVKIGASYV